MTITVQDVCDTELPAILAMNNAAVPNVNALDEAELRRLCEQAVYCRTARRDGVLAGFLLAMKPGAEYASPNYQWFCDNYDNFVYIDRVVVAGPHRGHGVGRVFYADVQSFAEPRAARLTCEVNLEPRNDVSLLFHGTYGFREVGQQTNGEKRVALLAKELDCFDYVQSKNRGAVAGQ
ncbi:MAG: hypothetical protein DHS20C11_07790 [Lysobacteraceae bacterium]|nr:MAG: hypothetical protein DHS20C11_07790 [Xanthomonadaceae bacterium]